MELDINRQIQSSIIRHVKRRQELSKSVNKEEEYDLSGLHYDNPSSLIKYLCHCEKTTKVDLSNSEIKKEVIQALAEELHCRAIDIEELNLSRLEAIDDDLLMTISHLMFC